MPVPVVGVRVFLQPGASSRNLEPGLRSSQTNPGTYLLCSDVTEALWSPRGHQTKQPSALLTTRHLQGALLYREDLCCQCLVLELLSREPPYLLHAESAERKSEAQAGCNMCVRCGDFGASPLQLTLRNTSSSIVPFCRAFSRWYIVSSIADDFALREYI